MTLRQFLIPLALALLVATPTMAAEYALDGNPSLSDKALWGRKSGTTNTKEDVEVTSGAIHVFSEGGTATTPPTGASATQVQGTAADAAAAVGNPVQIGGVDGSGNAQRVLTDTTGAVATYSGAPAAASILVGHQAQTATTAATTIITIPAGSTWYGTVTVSADVGVAAASATAGQALGTVTTAGAGVTPAAGTVHTCEARAGANAATGNVGSQGNNSCKIEMYINCASGTCTLQGASTQAGTASRVSFSASGRLL